MAAERRRQGYAHDSVEFGRVVAFSDGMFAIAMTLLVIGIVVPAVGDKDSVGDLADALEDLQSNVLSFFISFAVIGRYWLAHHTFFSLLERIDSGLISLNLVYLGFIAFLPFPTALFGTYIENPLAVTIYALSVAIVSGIEVLLMRRAQRDGLFRRRFPPDVYRWGTAISLVPVVVFAISIPIAFASTGAAVLSWLLFLPVAKLADRWKPAGADRYLRA